MKKLSVVLATYNEEGNIGECLDTVKNIADEIIVVDGGSLDKTVSIARKMGAIIIETTNPKIFHINKQKALDAAKNAWILQLDADERVEPSLAEEIKKVISMNENELNKYQKKLPELSLFKRHQKLLEERDGVVGKGQGVYVGFFIPRKNYFLGRYLRYGGVYPDGVIRLVKKGKAHFPCKSVHEQIVIQGKVGWLQNDLLHLADKSFDNYLKRNSLYIDHLKSELRKSKVGKNPIQSMIYFIIKPFYWFLLTQVRHKGILDGWQGMVFSFFSALRFPRAYWRYLCNL